MSTKIPPLIFLSRCHIIANHRTCCLKISILLVNTRKNELIACLCERDLEFNVEGNCRKTSLKALYYHNYVYFTSSNLLIKILDEKWYIHLC